MPLEVLRGYPLSVKGLALLLVLLLSNCDSSDDAVIAPKSSFDIAKEAMLLVPQGAFIMGSDRKNDAEKQKTYGLLQPFFFDQHPVHDVTLKAFWIDKYEVSNQDYRVFIETTGRSAPFLWSQNAYNVSDARLSTAHIDNLRLIAREYMKLDLDSRRMTAAALLKALSAARQYFASLPVSDINWWEAEAYCQSRGKRLPTEAEWEKAARGSAGNLYPWGNEWKPENIGLGDNTKQQGLIPVAENTKDRSPYGVYGLAGNAMEWVQDDYKAYPNGTSSPSAATAKDKVIRGGSADIGHYALSEFFMGSHRAHRAPEHRDKDLGFRCAKDAKFQQLPLKNKKQ